MRVRLFVLVVSCAASTVLLAPAAQAACHAFVSAAPSSVKEGGKVTVTIERDAAVNPSSVRVTTVDGTARAGSDYTKVDQRVEFTSETSRTIQVATTGDTADEPNETFRIHLSDGAGCAVNPNFQYGPDATVTIQDDDAPPAAPAPPPASRAPVPATLLPMATPQPTPAATPSPTPTASPSPSPSPSPTPLASPAAADDDDDLSAAAIAAIIAAALAVASAIGVALWRRTVTRP